MRRDPCPDCDPDCDCQPEPVDQLAIHVAHADAEPEPHAFTLADRIAYTQPFGLTARIW